MGLILASAMRHSVGCPAMGMGGGTIELWSGLPPPSGPPLKQHREMAKSAPTGNADFVEINLMVSNAIKLTRNNQIAAIWEEGYREGTYMGEMRLSAMMGRGKLRSGRQGRSFRSKRGSMSRNQPRKVWQQR